MQRSFLFLLIVLLSTIAKAQTFNQKVDNLIQTEYKDDNGPGGVFLITEKGKPVYQKPSDWPILNWMTS